MLGELKDDVNTTKNQLMATDADVKQVLAKVNTTLTQRVSKLDNSLDYAWILRKFDSSAAEVYRGPDHEAGKSVPHSLQSRV